MSVRFTNQEQGLLGAINFMHDALYDFYEVYNVHTGLIKELCAIRKDDNATWSKKVGVWCYPFSDYGYKKISNAEYERLTLLIKEAVG